jgi:16S rRNA (cytidine1402-2'-O)-methyltransferase
MNRTNGRLYLIPTPLGKRKENTVLPEHTLSVVRNLRCFIVEKAQTTQSFLQWIEHPVPGHELIFRVLNKKTPDQEVFSFLKLIREQDTGLMSEAGAPGVADPGARIVQLAHDNGIEVIPLVGPSSILLALMASGLNGQKFAFHGYLSLNDGVRAGEITELELESGKKNQTQIVMETPHRNTVLFSQLISRLRPSTRLCIACNLTQPDEWIRTASIHEWKSSPAPDFQKKPALFLFSA